MTQQEFRNLKVNDRVKRSYPGGSRRNGFVEARLGYSSLYFRVRLGEDYEHITLNNLHVWEKET